MSREPPLPIRCKQVLDMSLNLGELFVRSNMFDEQVRVEYQSLFIKCALCKNRDNLTFERNHAKIFYSS